VTFKDLQKLVQSQTNPGQSQPLQRVGDKPFWIWDRQQHSQEDIKTKGDCCFNHIIGLPKQLDLTQSQDQENPQIKLHVVSNNFSF
jgi:hypothetical protein